MAGAIPRRRGQAARSPLQPQGRRAAVARRGNRCRRHRPVCRPKAGRITFREYAEHWRQAQVHRPSSAAHVERMLRRHAYPTFGDRSCPRFSRRGPGLGAPPERLTEGEAQSARTRDDLGAAQRRLRDHAVGRAGPGSSPTLARAPGCRQGPQAGHPPDDSASRPDPRPVPPELAALVTFTAGTGMRQGEVFGLTVDRIDFLRREVRVERQFFTRPARRTEFGPTKTPASVRTIPLPEVVVDALAAHLAQLPSGGARPRVHDRRRADHASGLRPPVAARRTCRRPRARHWHARPTALLRVAVDPVRRERQDRPSRLGHASAAETLDTYSHLWPDSDDRTRAAIDAVLGQSPGDRVTKLLGD